MKTRVNKLYIKTEKGKPPVQTDCVTLLENRGVAGDIFCAEGAKRQVSILFSQSVKKLECLNEKGVCVKRFSCNIVLDGAFTDEIKNGILLKTGDVTLSVCEVGKSCFGFCGENDCPLVGEAVFARVETGGEVREGDEVSYG